MVETLHYYDIINRRSLVYITPEQKDQMQEAFDFLDEFRKGRVIYGINTGFGPMAQYQIDDQKLLELQYNIIRSHCCGVGEAISKEAIRAAMYARLQTFLRGKSAVHTDVAETLVAFLNNDIIPVVPQHGGVGASGDLVQLSHIALTLIGEGEVFFRGERVDTAKAMEQCGIAPLKLHIRDGLALVNGTAVMTGISLVNIQYAEKLLRYSTLASVLLNEIVSSYDDFMSEVLNDLKGHRGQSEIASQMRDISSSSAMLLNRKESLYDVNQQKESIFKHKVQPYYSLRCVPQILGPVYDTIVTAKGIVEEELYSVDDNPIVDPESKSVYHGGNFHGDYISMEMDKLKIAITKLTMLAERQINYIFHDKINEILPPFANLGTLGLNYGLQAAQFTATSTTAECQMLSNPMCVHSIPCNNDNQDVVSMGTNSALITQRVIENSFQVLSIEMIALVQAVDYLKIADKLSNATRKLYDDIREIVPLFIDDSTKHNDIVNVIEYLKSNE